MAKTAGDKVTGATINGNGSIIIRAERVGAETLLARIVHMVGEAQRTRAPIQRLADVIAAYFVQAVIAIADRHGACVVVSRPRATIHLCVHQRHCGAHHRLSLRRRSRHADLDDGCHGAGRSRWYPVPQCRSDRANARYRYVSRGQDRHADAGPTCADRFRRSKELPRTKRSRWWQASSSFPSIRSATQSSRGAKARGLIRCRRAAISMRSTASACRQRSTAGACWWAAAFSLRSRASTRALGRQAEVWRGRSQDGRITSPSMTSRRALPPVADPIKESTPEAIAATAEAGHAYRHADR